LCLNQFASTVKVVIASKNPVKINAVLKSFELCWDAAIDPVSVRVPSGVSDQPMNEDETLLGARTRVNNAKMLHPNADFYVGIEGGVALVGERLFAYAWIVVLQSEKESHARTATFELPPRIRELISQGMELGDADDLVFQQKNSKQQNGAVGLLTGDRVTREYFIPKPCIWR